MADRVSTERRRVQIRDASAITAFAAFAVFTAPVATAQEPAKLTLDRAVVLALEHNPGLTAARASLDEAVADGDVARSRLLPRITGTASAVLLEPDRLGPISLSGVPNGGTLFSRELYAGVVASQPVFDGSAWSGLAAARHGVDARELELFSAEVEARYAVTVAFVRLLAAEGTVAVAEDAVARQTAFEARVLRMQEVDRATRLDLLRAQAQRIETERSLVAAVESKGTAQAQLRRSLGVGPDVPLAIDGELVVKLEDPPAEAVLYADALRTNPVFAVLDARVAQADSGVRGARAEHLPDLTVAASYGYRSRDVGGSADEYVVGAYLAWPLFSGLAIEGQVDRARAQRAAVAAGSVAREDQLRVDVRSALASWRTSQAAVAAAAARVAVDREAVDAATALFDAGRATTLDVVTAQADLARAEAAMIQAYGDYAVARASVYRLIGSRR